MPPRRPRIEPRVGKIVSQVVGALIAGRGLRPEEVCDAIGMSRTTFYNRMAKSEWKVDELAAIADYLDEPVASFFDGLGGRFTGEEKPADAPPPRRVSAAASRRDAVTRKSSRGHTGQ